MIPPMATMNPFSLPGTLVWVATSRMFDVNAVMIVNRQASFYLYSTH